jgi:hypothetical protein
MKLEWSDEALADLDRFRALRPNKTKKSKQKAGVAAG